MEFSALQAVEPLIATFQNQNVAVLSAPPGTGKTTLLPIELLKSELFADQKIIMLEPRRAAARAAARRIAFLLNEPVGQTVGWQVRHERCVSSATRLEIVTEGILIRRLQQDPELSGVGLVIFDEFHERSLNCDLSLALTLDVQANLREELKLLVMSATLDNEAIATALNNAPQISLTSPMYPVETIYAGSSLNLAQHGAKVMADLMKQNSGSGLLFLAGANEINQACEICRTLLPDEVNIYPLYGQLDKNEQDKAIFSTGENERKLVIATNIAETSLTIEGVRLVVDSGVSKVACFEPRSGLTSLKTKRISLASAEQRRGRAGRTESGICVRLWKQAEESQFSPFNTPEILDADLATLLLEIAIWGSNINDLQWITPPPEPAVNSARTLLQMLDLIDENSRPTKRGRAAHKLPVHPRLAAMLLVAKELNIASLGAEIATIIEERPMIESCDLVEHIYFMRGNPKRCGVLLNSRNQLLKLLKLDYQECSVEQAGQLIAIAYPDRVAKARAKHSELYLTSCGKGFRLPPNSDLKRAEFLAVAGVNSSGSDGVILQASEVTLAELNEVVPQLFTTKEQIKFNSEREAVEAVRVECLGDIELKSSPLAKADSGKIAQELLCAIQRKGLSCLNWTAATTALCARVNFAYKSSDNSPDFPDWSTETLANTMEDWLLPYIDGMRNIAQIKSLELHSILWNSLSYEQQQSLNSLFPERFATPAGSQLRIDYSGEAPRLSARVQEFYGCKVHPTVGRNRIPLQLELLSPAQRPVQVTTDLPTFWQGNWELVKKELKGRYPKHIWADDPANATPTLRAKPKK